MMVIGTVLPLIFVLGFVFYFFFSVKIGKKYLTIKITHWMLIVYIGVLILATMIVPFLSQDHTAVEKMEQEKSDVGGFDSYTELHSKLSNGEITEIDPIYLQNEMSFEDYQKDSMKIVSGVDYGPQIFVERKETNDSQIEVAIYSTGLVVNGNNFSNLLKPLQLDLTEDVLTITPVHQTIDIAISSNFYPVRQFTNESMFENHYYSSLDSFVYLRVPADLELERDELYFEYIFK